MIDSLSAAYPTESDLLDSFDLDSAAGIQIRRITEAASF
jgi:hypothetical protein